MLVALLTILFVVVALFLALFILIQQGKGDMGMGALGGSTQMLFGGSGGQTFFEKATWVLGGIFMLGALGLSVMKSQEIRASKLKTFSGSTITSEQKPKVAPTEHTEAPAPAE